MGTNRRKTVKDRMAQVVKERRIKARRERKQAKKVANRLLGIRKVPKETSGVWTWGTNGEA